MKHYILTEDNLPNGLIINERGYVAVSKARVANTSSVTTDLKMYSQQYANKMIEYYANQLAEANQVLEPFINGLYDSLDSDISPKIDDIFKDGGITTNVNLYLCPNLSENMYDTIKTKIASGFNLNSLMNIIYAQDVGDGSLSQIPFTIDNNPVVIQIGNENYDCICIKRYDGNPYEISDILIACGQSSRQIFMNKCIHRSDMDYSITNTNASEWVTVNDIVKTQMDNNTILDMFQYIAVNASQALARGADIVDLSTLQGYMENQCGGQLSATASSALTEVQSAVSQDSSPSGVLQYLIMKMRESCSTTTGSSSILTDNSSFVTRSLSSGLLKGTAITASAIATVVGIAVGGVFGAAIAVVSTVASTLLTTAKDVSDEVTYARYSTNAVVNDLFPVGLCQYVSQDIDLINHPGLDQTGVGSAASPCFEIFSHISNSTTNLVEQEVHISAAKTGWNALPSIFRYDSTSGRVSWDLGTSSTVVRNAMASEQDSNITKYLGDKLAADKAFKMSYITGLVYFISTILCSGTTGASRKYVSLNSSNEFESAIAMLLSTCLQYNSKAAVWDDITWSELTGADGSGALGGAIGTITSVLMSTGWYQQYNISFTDKSFAEKYLDAAYALNTGSPLQHSTGFVASYSMPYTSILLPTFERTTFWMDVAMTIAGIVLTSIAAIAISMVVKNRVRSYNTMQTAKVEAAWSKLAQNPNKANADAYSKLVRKHNSIAQFTGGTLYSRTSYWGDASSSNDTVRANVNDYAVQLDQLSNTLAEVVIKLDVLSGLLSDVNTNITGSPLDINRQPQLE